MPQTNTLNNTTNRAWDGQHPKTSKQRQNKLHTLLMSGRFEVYLAQLVSSMPNFFLYLDDL